MTLITILVDHLHYFSIIHNNFLLRRALWTYFLLQIGLIHTLGSIEFAIFSNISTLNVEQDRWFHHEQSTLNLSNGGDYRRDPSVHNPFKDKELH